MLANAARKYGEQVVSHVITMTVGGFIVYLVAILSFIPDMNRRMETTMTVVIHNELQSIARDSVLAVRVGTIHGITDRHDYWMNGNGSPGLRMQVSRLDQGYIDLRDDVTDLRRRMARKER